MKCHGSIYKVNAQLTPKESKIFHDLQKLSIHECAGAITFDKYGKLNKFNVFLGGNDSQTWGHGHIVGFHTHPTKAIVKKYSPPSYKDYVNSLRRGMRIFNEGRSMKKNIIGVGLVFDKMGCWIFRPTLQLLHAAQKAKSQNIYEFKTLLKVLHNNTRIINIQFSQPKHIITHNKNKFPKITIKKYTNLMKHILTPGKSSNLGYSIQFIPIGKKIIIKDVYQCLESLKSATKLYNIPPQIEQEFLRKKYY